MKELFVAAVFTAGISRAGSMARVAAVLCMFIVCVAPLSFAAAGGSVDMGMIQKAAAQGIASAQYVLGASYLTGTNGVAKDERKAAEWFQKSAAQGDADAQLAIGILYADGRGVPRDLRKAIEWLQKSAAQGNADAQHQLGVYYFKGWGVTQDAKKAEEWLQKAANQGHKKAKGDLAEVQGQQRIWMMQEAMGRKAFGDMALLQKTPKGQLAKSECDRLYKAQGYNYVSDCYADAVRKLK